LQSLLAEMPIANATRRIANLLLEIAKSVCPATTPAYWSLKVYAMFMYFEINSWF